MESSNELLWYALSVVAFPALIAWLAAMPALVGPLRTRRAAVEMSVAFALALAFLVSNQPINVETTSNLVTNILDESIAYLEVTL